MLWKYAPATDMDGDRPAGGLYGASGRHLQMGRCRRGRSLLRSGLSGCGKDRHGGVFVFRDIGRRRARRKRADHAGAAEVRGRPELRRIFNHLTGVGTDLFRRRCRGRALESQPHASPQSIHHVAFERQAAGFPVRRRIVALPRLDRGTYALAATITDQQTSESETSNSVTFFVRQPSSLSPQSPLHK